MLSTHWHVFLCCLVYGFGEKLRDQANSCGNMAFFAIGSSIISARNMIYLSFVAFLCFLWFDFNVYCKTTLILVTLVLAMLASARLNGICPYLVPSFESEKQKQEMEKHAASK